ncbi:hypothetical protein NPIL_516931 [Nephila pilipes]|uniref:Uncharacterized protein n=1 Tax=Nephila pilipes TaxID=299642 RepID=A0A8X6QK68_NEPPI|nr:hypothetical protein NPIL_516931 [Nephila pilipes]
MNISSTKSREHKLFIRPSKDEKSMKETEDGTLIAASVVAIKSFLNQLLNPSSLPNSFAIKRLAGFLTGHGVVLVLPVNFFLWWCVVFLLDGWPQCSST